MSDYEPRDIRALDRSGYLMLSSLWRSYLRRRITEEVLYHKLRTMELRPYLFGYLELCREKIFTQEDTKKVRARLAYKDKAPTTFRTLYKKGWRRFP